MKKLLSVLIILSASILCITPSLFAKCGKETRQTIDSLRCEDNATQTWYQLDVNKMCGTRQGVEQTAIEIAEERPNFIQYQNRIFIKQLPSLLYEHRDEKEFLLFRQRAEKNGRLEAYAIISPDGATIEKIRLYIKTNANNECSKIVDIRDAWNSIW